jgi:cytoskeleton protein RodZ
MTERSETGSVGARLKLARESRGMTLRQIANTTRIAVSALDAIERDDVKKLPGGIFARSFIRAYASELKLDVEQTVAEFFAQFPEPVDGPAALADQSDDGWVFGVPAAVLRGAMLAIPALALLGWMVFGGRGSTPRPEPTPAVERAATPHPEVAPSATARPVSDVVPAGGAIPDASPIVPAAALTLHLTARAECWVSITADGREVVSRLMGVGEEEAVRAASELRIKVGDASAVGMRLNGSPVRPLGRAGQVVTLRIDTANAAGLVETH